MDIEEEKETQFFGVFKESLNTVSSRRKFFGLITLSLILPLSFFYIGHIQISTLLFTDILLNAHILEGSSLYNDISCILSTKWTTFFLFKIGYSIFFINLALLSTSAVVYTIACIYTAKETSLRKFMSSVPKVLKRLMDTFIWNFVILLAYNIIAFLIFSFGVVLFGSYTYTLAIFVIMLVTEYLSGLVTITIIWHLATVISVLDEWPKLRL
ncbi:unnamed protein product [Fraxinus pennsylvanica]|uniref:Uncharacterized protein n=1 Tax=Fraxinus pennsylvanica TaxID=56036 RepID=A0AAD2A2Y0_9LAMI|nr:unnamed protein product [Fraxinus pennsylvanica]